jgi:hypothetical protein
VVTVSDAGSELDAAASLVPVTQPPTAAIAAEQLLQAGFGLAAVITEVIVGALAGVGGRPIEGVRRTGTVAPLVDFSFGVAWVTARTTGRLVGTVVSASAPIVDLALDPPLVPQALRPIGAVRWFSNEWQQQRPQSVRSLHRFTTRAAPDAAGAAIDLLPINLIADRVLERVDVDRIVASALQHVDLDAVGIDVLAQMDLDPLIEAAVAQIDLGAVVADVLSQLDLTTIVIDQVDLKRVVTTAMEALDLTTLVKEQVDLIDLADYVVDGIDLQEIIRESTGSIASTTVKQVRLQSVEADEVVNKIVDRILFRRKARKTEAPIGKDDSHLFDRDGDGVVDSTGEQR